MDEVLIEVFGLELYKILVIYFTILFLILITLFVIVLIKNVIEGEFLN